MSLTWHVSAFLFSHLQVVTFRIFCCTFDIVFKYEILYSSYLLNNILKIFVICCIFTTEILNSSFIGTQELFGRNWIRLSQFIGTKSSHQVKSYIRSHLRHLGPANENCSQVSFSRESGICSSGVLGFTELIDDMQIPASMEEVCLVLFRLHSMLTCGTRGQLYYISFERSARIFIFRVNFTP
jgi:hypothetical protein